MLLRNINRSRIMFLSSNNTAWKQMQIDVSPSCTYAIASNLRPGELKLGKSNAPAQRKGTLRTADPDIYIAATYAFLNAYKAERAAQKHFSKRRVAGEWYRVTLEELNEFYKNWQRGELEQIHAISKAARFLANHEKSILAEKSTPLASDERGVLLQRTLAGLSGMSVIRGIQAALSVTASLKSIQSLAKAGLLVQQADRVALLDRSRGGPLDRFFAKTEYAETWRNAFRGIAGFDKDGACVKMTTWKRMTGASQELIDRVCAQ